MQMRRRFSETPERFAAFHSIFLIVQTANAHHANGGTVTTNDSSDDNSTTLPRRQLGQYLKENRLGAGLKLEEVAPLMQWSASKLSRIEAGKSPNVRVVDVEALCRIYDIEDAEVVAGLIGLAKESTGKSWWQAYDDIMSGNFDLYVGMESSAKCIQIFRPDTPSGLFQTPAYARAADRIYFSDITDEELDRRIELKTKRQALISRRTNAPTIELILQEGALRTVLGGPQVMSDQLFHLANMPINVTVRILPFTAGFPLGTAPGPFTILDFGRDAKGREVSPTVVYIESYAGDMYLERTKDVRRYRQAYSAMQQSSLDIASSKRLLRQVAKEFRA